MPQAGSQMVNSGYPRGSDFITETMAWISGGVWLNFSN